jgi:hypothetical protein
MINPAPHIRKAFYSLLNGAVSYEGAVVSVIEGEDISLEANRIVIGEDNLTSGQSDKHSFSGNYTQLIEVVTERTGSNPTKHADTIANQVMNLVQPSPRGTGLVSSEFQIIGLTLSSRNVVRDEGANNSKIVRVLLRYSFNVNQINL